MAAALEISAVRRLAAILAADVAGYSRLMGGTRNARTTNGAPRALIRPKIAEHHGRIVRPPAMARGRIPQRCRWRALRSRDAARHGGIYRLSDRRRSAQVRDQPRDVIVRATTFMATTSMSRRRSSLGGCRHSLEYGYDRARPTPLSSDLGGSGSRTSLTRAGYRIPIAENTPAKAPLRAPIILTRGTTV
jgi:hypothetical protein